MIMYAAIVVMMKKNPCRFSGALMIKDMEVSDTVYHSKGILLWTNQPEYVLLYAPVLYIAWLQQTRHTLAYYSEYLTPN